MTAAWDPKLCKSLARCRFLTPSRRNVHTYAGLHTSSPIESIDASGERNLGSDHYRHFQHFSALVHSRGRQRLSEIQSVWPRVASSVNFSFSPLRARPVIWSLGTIWGLGQRHLPLGMNCDLVLGLPVYHPSVSHKWGLPVYRSWHCRRVRGQKAWPWQCGECDGAQLTMPPVWQSQHCSSCHRQHF